MVIQDRPASPASAAQPSDRPGSVDVPERLPLVIGVTGHRDMLERDRLSLEAKVLEIFRLLRSRHPNTPLVLLSPLAEGADQLVARVGLEFGAQLIAPLPMEIGAYEEDFGEPEALAEFRKLLGRASRAFTVAGPDAGREDSREGCYARMGAYIAAHCQILIALWDGIDNGREGGTGQVVGFKLEGVPHRFAPANSPLDIPEAGPVYQLVTPRAGQAEPERKLDLIVRYPGAPGAPGDEGAMRAVYDRIFGLMDEYNRDIISLRPSLAGERATSRSYVVSEAEAGESTGPLAEDLDRYAVADTLAQHFQRKTHGALHAMIGVVFVLALLFQAHVRSRQVYKLDSASTRPWYAATVIVVDPASRVYLTTLDVLYLGLLGVAITLFRRARRGNYQNKYLDYRAIAEGHRVQFFWRLAGIGETVADHYLRKQKGDLDWIRNAVRIGDILGGREAVARPEDDRARIALVMDRWVVDQERFFTRRATRAFEQSGWLRTLANGSFYAGLIFLVIRAFAPPDHPLIITLATVLAVAILLNVYAKVTALSEHAKQYRRMSALFAHASRQLTDLLAADRVAEARGLLRDLGRESLAENGDWVLLHRERPLELPRV